MLIHVQQLQSGRWLAWIDGTIERGAGDTMLEALGSLAFQHPERFAVGRVERVFAPEYAA